MKSLEIIRNLEGLEISIELLRNSGFVVSGFCWMETEVCSCGCDYAYLTFNQAGYVKTAELIDFVPGHAFLDLISERQEEMDAEFITGPNIWDIILKAIGG